MRETVILAAGTFPAKGGEGERLLRAAKRVVACDSAAKSYHRVFHRWPDAVVGDFDSLQGSVPCRIVRDDDQNANDLAKAIRFCRAEGWNDLVIVGATGLREDHTVGNIYRALAEGVRMVTDAGEFLPVRRSLTFKTWKNTGVSVFAIDPKVKMTSKGLKWKLAGVRFENPWCATLNRASSTQVTVSSDRPAFVFVERNPKAARVVIALGSNLGDRAKYLARALKALAALPLTRLVAASEIVETEGVGVPKRFKELKFLNQIALFETTADPLTFSRRMHAIEDRLGRVRTVKNGPRTIDIDMIDYAGVKLKTKSLILPHPRAKKRAFVMEPLKSLGLELK